jgi:acetyl-CoA acetyltransferase
MATTIAPAVVGAGTTETFQLQPDRSRFSIVAEALRNTLTDAGLSKDDLDGLVTQVGSPLSINYGRLCEALGLDVDFVSQFWSHGRWVGNALIQAIVAVEAGLAEYVAVGVGLQFSQETYSRMKSDVSLTDLGLASEHATRPWYGVTAPVGGTALVTRYYLERYGATPADLAPLAVQLREYAAQNTGARNPVRLSVDEYLDAPWVVDPLREPDCWSLTDGGAFVVVTTAENARSHDNPAFVAARRPMGASADQYLFARPGLGVRNQSEFEYKSAPEVVAIYESAGVDRSEVDGFYTYDAYTPNIWFALEQWGFSEPGEAYRDTREGWSEDGDLPPINTNGGLTADGHVLGWNTMVEMYDQLAGRCGDRQIPDAACVQWGSPFGDSIILCSQ